MTTEEVRKVTTQYSARKIGPFLFEPDHCLKSPWWQLVILYGFFYIFVIAFCVYQWKQKNKTVSDVFLTLLIVTSTLLIIIPEFFYMKDIYPDHYRANTMFKLVFQAFIMLSIVSGSTILKTVSKEIMHSLHLKKKLVFLLYPILTVLLLTLVFTYPFFAIKSYYNQLTTYISLDGLTYLKNRNPNDYEAIKWLNTNVKGQPTVLEAQGDSYSDYERISANTGFPTVLGWYVHEWLWRGQDAPGPRATEVQQLYESTDIEITNKLIKKYSIAYVVVGSLEKQKYTQLNEDKFTRLGKKVFESGSTKIFRILQ